MSKDKIVIKTIHVLYNIQYKYMFNTKIEKLIHINDNF